MKKDKVERKIRRSLPGEQSLHNIEEGSPGITHVQIHEEKKEKVEKKVEGVYLDIQLDKIPSVFSIRRLQSTLFVSDGIKVIRRQVSAKKPIRIVITQ